MAKSNEYKPQRGDVLKFTQQESMDSRSCSRAPGPPGILSCPVSCHARVPVCPLDPGSGRHRHANNSCTAAVLVLPILKVKEEERGAQPAWCWRSWQWPQVSGGSSLGTARVIPPSSVNGWGRVSGVGVVDLGSLQACGCSQEPQLGSHPRDKPCRTARWAVATKQLRGAAGLGRPSG